jgi:sorting and assembly machinery component 37
MVLELHIWGSAFELPSIDASCLAAIIYLRHYVPHGGWALVPSSSPRVSPLGELPALCDGELWVAGYSSIVDHLRNIFNGEQRLNQNFSAQQQADDAALTAFLMSRGQPLLDLCLFVSSDNYHDCTRPALAGILTWPDSWTVPHRLRDQAKKRSEHLGLSSLDVDAAQEEDDKKESTYLTAQIPKSLRKPKQTVSSLLGRNQQKNRFRLDAVTESFFEPLSDILDDKNWLLGRDASSADCLAVGFLALMRSPQLQHKWLAETLQRTHPRLDEWARKIALDAFGTSIDTFSQLPWQAPAPRSFPQLCHEVLEASIGAVPVLGTRYLTSEIDYPSNLVQGRAREKLMQLARLRRRRDLYLETLTSVLSSAGLIAWLLYVGMLPLPRWTRSAPAQRRFGEAGSLLGLR